MFVETTIFRECYATFILAISYILYGCNNGFSGFLIPRLKEEGIELSSVEESFIGSLPYIVTSCCVFPWCFLMGKFGRKINLQIVFILNIIGWFILSVAMNVPMIWLGTIVTSIGTSSIISITSTYISETCKTEHRGLLLSLDYVFIPLGVSVDYCLVTVISWRATAAIIALISVCGLANSFLLPETKYWQLLRNKPNQAKASLLWFEPNLCSKEIDARIEDMQRSIHCNTDNCVNRFPEFLKSFSKWSHFKPVLLGLALFALRPGNGRPLFISYIVNIFEDLGTPYDCETLSLWFGMAQNIGNISYLLLMHFCNRKTMFNWLCILMTICLGATVITRGIEGTQFLPWLSVGLLFIYFSVACTGLMSCVSIITSEIQIPYFRAEAMNLFVCILSIVSFLYTFTYPIVEKIVTIDAILLFFLANVVISWVVVVLWIPETSKRKFYDTDEIPEKQVDNACNKV